jgi:aldehyde dehydrogenase (NAD+)
MFVAWKLGPALAAGNSVVYKPSPRAVLSTLEVIRTVDEALPPGAVNVVTGTGPEVGEALSGHPEVRKVSLTGGTDAGQAVMRNAAGHVAPVSLELGGKSPNVVFPDADLEAAVEGALVGIFFNQGQQCTAGSRLFLHEDVYDDFLESFVERTRELNVGDPLSPTTDVGPMVDHAHQRDVRAYVERAREEGATVHYDGGELDPELAGAPFVQPTVLTDVDDDDTVACEEVFGPVLSVLRWRDREEVIRRANDTEYGLAAAVWTGDLETAHEVSAELEAGTVWVNTYNDMFEPAPYGGYKQSGIGRELSEEALREYQRTKSVKVSLGDVPKL